MKTGLVFSGGGAKGAYEIGAWKALDELNIKCDIVTGVSIGSVNAALYTQKTLGKALSLWKKVELNAVFDVSEMSNDEDLKMRYIKAVKNGGLEPSHLKSKLQKNLDIDKIYNSNIDFGLITVAYPSMKMIELTKKDIPKDEFIDYLLASCTIYPLFKLKEIENKKYVDGGFRKTVPFELAKKMGATKFIVVNISFNRRYKPNKDEDVILITPNNKIGMPIVFDQKIAERNIKYGYNDTLKAFHVLYGNKYTFKGIYDFYEPNDVFSTFKTYIQALEYLASITNLDDSKIYTKYRFDLMIKNRFKDICFNHKISLKEIKNKKERVLYIYDNLLNNKKINIEKIFKNDYLAAYYLYINKLVKE